MSLPTLAPLQLWTIIRAVVFGFTTIDAEMCFCRYSRRPTAGFLGARVDAGWLKPVPLRKGLNGFQATRAACTTIGANPNLIVSLGSPQAVLPRWMALTDCANRRVMPLAATAADLSGVKSTDYRLVPGETRPFAMLMVSLPGNPVRARYRVEAQLRALRADTALGPLVAAGELAVRVLTPTAAHAAALADVLRAGKLSGPVEIETLVEAQKWLLGK